MSRVDRSRTSRAFAAADGLRGSAKGSALEEIIVEIFDSIPGLRLATRNVFDEAGSQEIDIGYRNQALANGLFGFGHEVLVECKNWTRPLGSREVAWFVHKLDDAQQEAGVLVAASGVSGNPRDLTNARSVIDKARIKQRVSIVVVTRRELERVASGEALADLIGNKLFRVRAHGRVYEATDLELDRLNDLASGVNQAGVTDDLLSVSGQISESRLLTDGAELTLGRAPSSTKRPLDSTGLRPLGVNAGSRSHTDIARTFTLHPAFDRLTRPYNNVLVGPRGSGKTTLLKMLDPAALDEWDHPDADIVREGLAFTGVYIPAESLMYETVDTLCEHTQYLTSALFTFAVCARFVEAMERRINYWCSTRPTKADAREVERRLTREMAESWGLRLERPSIAGLLREIRGRVSRTAHELRGCCDGDSLEANPSAARHTVDLISTISAAIERCNEALEEPTHIWCLLVDDAECCPPVVRSQLVSALRSSAPWLLVKLASAGSGDGRAAPVDSGALAGVDFELISLTNETVAYEFGCAVIGDELRRLGWPSDPERVFGISWGVGDLDSVGFADLLRRLSDRDPSFMAWVRANGQLEGELPGGRGQAILRRAVPLLVLRDAMLSDFDNHERRESGARLSHLWTGMPAVIRMCEGNPRLLITFVRETLTEAIGRSAVTEALQSKVLDGLQSDFISRIEMAARAEGDATLTLMQFIDKLGHALADAVAGPFEPEPPLSFTLDEGVSTEVAALVGEGIELGAVISISGEAPATEKPRLRLSYLLASRYRLPLRIGRAVPLSTLLERRGPRLSL